MCFFNMQNEATAVLIFVKLSFYFSLAICCYTVLYSPLVICKILATHIGNYAVLTIFFTICVTVCSVCSSQKSSIY